MCRFTRLWAFLSKRRSGREVDHINGVKRDNRAVNLEWVSASENMRRAFLLGLIQKPTGGRGKKHAYPVDTP